MTADSVEAEVDAWLREAPLVDGPDAAFSLVAALAEVIAERVGCDLPTAVGRSPRLDDAARLWIDSLPPGVAEPDVLGIAWERLIQSQTRRLTGAHFTPRPLAESIARRALECLRERIDLRRADSAALDVIDPAVGGGAFLLAAARCCEEMGLDRTVIVEHSFGIDIDPYAARIADATLQLWARGSARPHMFVADALTVDVRELDDRWFGDTDLADISFDLVIGNPPFLGQLQSDTTRDSKRRSLLLERFGVVARGYIDDAALFLVAGVETVSAGGVVAMIVPQSVLGATDTRAAREWLSSTADLTSVVVAATGSFSASVDVAALVFERVSPTAMTSVVTPDGVETEIETPTSDSWAPLLGQSVGVPRVDLNRPRAPGVSAPETLGSVATITAGFRQHFYGIDGAVLERGAVGEHPKLITSGAIEPFRSRWGERPIRFGKRPWLEPVLDVDGIDDDEVRRWFAGRLRPKILVASQTRVIELIVDVEGRLVPSVPVISVEPNDPDDLWPIAVFLSSPAVSAHVAGRGLGTGLSSKTIRVRAAELAALPTSRLRHGSISDAAESARQAHRASARSDWPGYRQNLIAMGERVTLEGEDPPELLDWWRARLRFPSE